MLRIAVCDNEENCQRTLLEMISCLPFPAEYLCFREGESLLAACAGHESAFDLVFMDIELDNGESGVRLAAELRRRLPDLILIFVSGYPHYFTEAFKVQPDQFLVKPVQWDMFLDAVNFAMSTRKRRSTMARFSFPVKNGLVTFRQDEICYLEARDHYISIVNTREAPLLIPGSLGREEPRFLPHGFIKVHRSYLVNLRHIRHIENRDVVMESGERVPISKGRYRQVFDQYTTYVSTIIEDLL